MFCRTSLDLAGREGQAGLGPGGGGASEGACCASNLFTLGVFAARRKTGRPVPTFPQKRWFTVHVLHSATAESRTSPDVTGPGPRAGRDCVGVSKVGLLAGLSGPRVMPLQSVASSAATCASALASAPLAVNWDWSPLSWALQPAPSLLPPLGSLGEEVSQKTALTPGEERQFRGSDTVRSKPNFPELSSHLLTSAHSLLWIHFVLKFGMYKHRVLL